MNSTVGYKNFSHYFLLLSLTFPFGFFSSTKFIHFKIPKDFTVQVVVKYGDFTLLLCKGQHGIVLKCVSHVQHAYFFNLILNFWRNRCR